MKRIDSKMLLEIVNDMTLIHNQIMQKEYYAAGSNFNRLQQAIVTLMKKEERYEQGDYDDEEQEEVQEQDECEAQCEEEKDEMREDLKDFRLSNEFQVRRIQELEEFVKLLLKSDHIYKPSIESTLRILKKENESMEDMLKYLPGFQPRPAF